ncbi:MAG TPA: M36 family metallopeptidase [bacterium]|nr:M36 family metallopeptidase [bacterium]
MTGQRFIVCLLAMVAFIAAFPGILHAFVQPQNESAVPEVPLAQHQAGAPTQAQLDYLDSLTAQRPVAVQFSEKTGSPRSVSGRLYWAKRADESLVAREAIDRFGQLYSIRPSEDALTLVKTSRSYSYSHYRFEQEYEGIPVWRAGLSVHIDGAGVVRRLNGEFYRGIHCATEPLLTAQDAEDVALSFLSPSEETDLSQQARLVIAPTERFRLAYQVKVFCRKPLGLFVLLVDAQNGDLLYLKNELLFSRVTGNVYDVNPGETPQAEMPIRDMKATAGVNVYYTDAEGYYDAEGEVSAHIEGPYCKALNDDFSRASWDGDATFVWDYAPTSTHFDEVCAFYHVNLIHAWLKDHLEFDGMDLPISVTVHYSEDMNNAFYSPTYNSISLGDGTLRDPAHDADIVMHEYGHAVVHNTASRDFSAQSLDEGYADYFTCSLHDDPLVGEWWMPPYLRNLDNDMVYPFDLVGEGHHDGQIWSGALWDIRKKYGADVADRIALGTLYYYGSETPSFLDARDAALDADEECFGSEHRNSIVEIFSKRGISDVSIASWSISEVEGNGDGVADPGETLDLSVQVRNLTGSMVSSSFIALQSDSPFIEVTDGLTQLPIVQGHEKVQCASPFRFKIATGCPADGVLEFGVKIGFDVDALIFAGAIRMTLGRSPEVAFLEHRIYDFVGNGDQEANPGELIVILPTLSNTGNATASNVRIRTFVRSPYVNARGGYQGQISTNTASYGDIEPGQTIEASESQNNIIEILESDTPDGYEYDVDYDLLEQGGRRWTGSFPVTVTGNDQTPPWVAYSEGSPTQVNQGSSFYVVALVIEPGRIASIGGELHNRAGDGLGKVLFTRYTQDLYVGFGAMPANEDVFLDITAEDANGNEGTKRNACAFGPTTFTQESNVLFVADDFADAEGMRHKTLEALAQKGLSADVWETEIRQLPGKSTLSKYAGGLVIFDAKYNPYYMSHYPYLAYRPVAVADAMQLGANVLLTGQLVGSYYNMYNEGGTFFEDTFHCEVGGTRSGDESLAIVGKSGDVIGDALSVGLSGTEEFPATPDYLTPLEGCDTFLHFADDESQKMGVRAENLNARGVYLTFEIGDVDDAEQGEMLFSRAVDWLMGSAETPSGVPVFAAGFVNTDLNAAGGEFEMQAYANPAFPIESLDLYIGGSPLGISLDETLPYFYTLDMHVGSLVPGYYTLELVASLRNGRQIVVWPYLPVGDYDDWQVDQRAAFTGGAGPKNPDAPRVLLAGFFSSELTPESGGTLNPVAMVDDPDGLSDIASVVLSFENHPGVAKEIELLDDGLSGDFAAGDGIYGMIMTKPYELPRGLHLLHITARDADGNTGEWPELVVNQ